MKPVATLTHILYMFSAYFSLVCSQGRQAKMDLCYYTVTLTLLPIHECLLAPAEVFLHKVNLLKGFGGPISIPCMQNTFMTPFYSPSHDIASRGKVVSLFFK